MESTATCLAGGAGRDEIERRDQMLNEQNEQSPAAAVLYVYDKRAIRRYSVLSTTVRVCDDKRTSLCISFRPCKYFHLHVNHFRLELHV